MNASELYKNIDYSESWLIEQIIKGDFETKKTKKVSYITIKKIDLFKLVLKFIKLNMRGE